MQLGRKIHVVDFVPSHLDLYSHLWSPSPTVPPSRKEVGPGLDACGVGDPWTRNGGGPVCLSLSDPSGLLDVKLFFDVEGGTLVISVQVSFQVPSRLGSELRTGKVPGTNGERRS